MRADVGGHFAAEFPYVLAPFFYHMIYDKKK